MKNIVILCASNNNNLKLSEKIKDAFLEKNASVELVDLTMVELPVYTPRQEKISTPENATTLADQLSKSDALVVVAPEYNGGVPPVLTNAISWVSRCGGKDWRRCFNGKKAIIATHSGSGGMHVLMSMRMQLSYLGMNVLGRQIHTHYNKELNLETLNDVIEQVLN